MTDHDGFLEMRDNVICWPYQACPAENQIPCQIPNRTCTRNNIHRLALLYVLALPTISDMSKH